MAPSIISTEPDESKNEQPWWIATVYKIGIPSAICIALVWFLAIKVQAKLEEIDINLKIHQTDSNTLVKQNQQVLQLLQTICINSAASNQERSQCFR